MPVRPKLIIGCAGNPFAVVGPPPGRVPENDDRPKRLSYERFSSIRTKTCCIAAIAPLPLSLFGCSAPLHPKKTGGASAIRYSAFQVSPELREQHNPCSSAVVTALG